VFMISHRTGNGKCTYVCLW